MYATETRNFLENLFRILECQKSIKLMYKYVEVLFVRSFIERLYISYRYFCR